MTEPAASHVQYLELPPPEHLSGLIECLWFMRSAGAPSPEPQRILPDGCIELIFNLSDRFQHLLPRGRETQPPSMVVGPLTSHMLIQPLGAIDLIGVRLRPEGASAFRARAWSELRDRTIALEDSEVDLPKGLCERLGSATGAEDRYTVLTSVLEQACRRDRTDPRVSRACGLIRRTGGALSVTELARREGISPRTLERLFDRHAGMSPKLLSRITRFQSVIRSAESSRTATLRDTAFDWGYYDQAHFLKDFRALAGVSPTVFFGIEANQLSEAFTSGSLDGFLQDSSSEVG